MNKRISTQLTPRYHSLRQFRKEWTICLNYPEFSLGIEVRLIPSCDWSKFWGWIRVEADSILRLTRIPAAGYKLRLNRVLTAGYKLRLTPSCAWLEFWRLDRSCSWFHPAANSSSSGWMRVTADSILRLARTPSPGYDIRLIPFCGWLELQRLDTSYSWLHPTTDSSSTGWIRLKADSILQLTRVHRLHLTCGWLIL